MTNTWRKARFKPWSDETKLFKSSTELGGPGFLPISFVAKNSRDKRQFEQ